MCTNIAITTQVHGVGKGRDGWFPVNQAVVGYDHSSNFENEHAVLIDFVNYDISTAARVAVELDLESGRALLAQLQAALEAADASGVLENSPSSQHSHAGLVHTH